MASLEGISNETSFPFYLDYLRLFQFIYDKLELGKVLHSALYASIPVLLIQIRR